MTDALIDPADVVTTYDDASWGDDGPTRAVEDVVESGHVLAFPRLRFVLDESERRFLDPRWADPKAKNVSVRWPSGELRGAMTRVIGPTSRLPFQIGGGASSASEVATTSSPM